MVNKSFGRLLRLLDVRVRCYLRSVFRNGIKSIPDSDTRTRTRTNERILGVEKEKWRAAWEWNEFHEILKHIARRKVDSESQTLAVFAFTRAGFICIFDRALAREYFTGYITNERKRYGQERTETRSFLLKPPRFT